MKEYTAVVKINDNGKRVLEIYGFVLSAELNAIKEKLGPIDKLPKNKLNKKLKIKIRT